MYRLFLSDIYNPFALQIANGLFEDT